MLSTKYLPHFGTQCYSFTSYLIYSIIICSLFVNVLQKIVRNKKPAPCYQHRNRPIPPKRYNVTHQSQNYCIISGDSPQAKISLAVIFVPIFHKIYH